MNKAKVTSRGRVTIPAELRKKLKIEPGTKIAFIDEGDGVLLLPINKEYIRSLAGFLNTKGRALISLMEEKKKERKL